MSTAMTHHISTRAERSTQRKKLMIQEDHEDCERFGVGVVESFHRGIVIVCSAVRFGSAFSRASAAAISVSSGRAEESSRNDSCALSAAGSQSAITIATIVQRLKRSPTERTSELLL